MASPFESSDVSARLKCVVTRWQPFLQACLMSKALLPSSPVVCLGGSGKSCHSAQQLCSASRHADGCRAAESAPRPRGVDLACPLCTISPLATRPGSTGPTCMSSRQVCRHHFVQQALPDAEPWRGLTHLKQLCKGRIG